MSERNMSIVYSSSLDALTEYNASFDKGVLRVCYVGKNRNNSFISKTAFERCIKSIYNCPIVCRYDREADEIGSHDMDVVRDADDNICIVNATNPVGVVPESAKYWWEEVAESDGAIHEYLCVDALLWKRQEAYKKIKKDGITDESMEITILEGAMQDGVYVIDRFEFTAFCLLGTAEPCYESASLMTFSKEAFQEEMAEMMREFKESMQTMQYAKEANTPTKNEPEGGKSTLDEKRALMAQYELTEDMLDFSLEDFSEDQLREKFEAIKAAKQFALAEQFREELIDALSAEKTETCFGEMSRYWYVDYDNDSKEVYCYDQNDWKLYGFTFALNGDHVEIDFEKKKRKKCAYVDFDEGEDSAVFAAVYTKMSEQYTANEKKWAKRQEEATEKITAMEAELKELQKFKNDAEQSAAHQLREEVLNKFTNLNGVDAFEELRENCDTYSVEDLEEKCFAILGRTQSGKFTVQEPMKAPKLPIQNHHDQSNDPYGGIFAEYGICPTK